MTIEEVIAANTAAVEENTAAIRELIELTKQDQRFKGAALCVQTAEVEPVKTTDEVVDDRVELNFLCLPISSVKHLKRSRTRKS